MFFFEGGGDPFESVFFEGGSFCGEGGFLLRFQVPPKKDPCSNSPGHQEFGFR